MFSNDELKVLIAGEMIGDIYPYSSRNEQEVDHYLKRLIAEVKREKIQVIEEPAHFGSGYASYFEWCCYGDEHVTVNDDEHTRTVEIEGLAVAISRLAPVVLIGRMDRSDTFAKDGKSLSGGRSVFSQLSDLHIEPAFIPLVQRLERLFMKYQYTILRKEDVSRLLPFQADIPTILREKRDYLIWDAIFYWED
ncbi:hypothetical protein [Solibacillus sp. FSL K6-1523]|uniref:hypothetical protein n=1 Tax=Solibacillus sp. FSL K6-1523 TaxID=2921471 RepID=UPI0030F55613